MCGDKARVRERLVEVSQQVQYRLRREGPVSQIDGVVPRAAVCRHRQRRGRLVVDAVGEAHVERRSLLTRGPMARRHDEGGVDAAREQRGDGDVGYGLGFDGGEQQPGSRVDRIRQPAPRVRMRLDTLVRAQVMTLRVDRETACSGKRLDVSEPRRGLWNVAEAQEVVTRLAIYHGLEAREREDRLHFACEHPLPVVHCVEQRLDPEAIAGEEQSPATLVVQGEGEDAPQPRQHALAALLVEMHQHFRVGGALEAVAAALQLRRERPVVVDLAVEHDVDGAVLVGHRLGARGRQIDQRQAAVHQVAPVVAPVARAVGPAMRQQRGCPRGPLGRGRQALRVEPPGYAAHGQGSRDVMRGVRRARPVRPVS